MGHDRPTTTGDTQGYVHPDPVMDAALNWFFLIQADPDNRVLRDRFEAWRREAPANNSKFQAVAAAWDIPEATEVAHNLAKATITPPPVNVVEFKQPKKKIVGWIAAIAAAILVTIGLQQYPSLSIRWEADYITAAGDQREVNLPDGSKVTMNTNTAIALDFKNGARSVQLLKGEAYFDVVHDPSHPFIVAAEFSKVEVKGTAFSVRSDDNQDLITLERGHVEVRRPSDLSDRADLDPGQAIVATATSILSAQSIDSSVAFAWLKGQVAFQDRPFKSVVHELSRYYGHSVVIANGAYDGVKVNGRYRVNDPERAIRSLATTVGASVTRIPGGILILR